MAKRSCIKFSVGDWVIINALTLVQKWVPFGTHFVFCENYDFCRAKWVPIGGHNEKIWCLKSKEHLKTSCTKMYVTLSKIENICSNVTKYEPNWPGGSRDMAIYFHGLRQEFWWFWVKIELWRPFRGWSSWVDWPLVRCESVMCWRGASERIRTSEQYKNT